MAETNGTLTVSQALQIYTEAFQRWAWTRDGTTFSGQRSLYDTLGYQHTLAYEDYFARYQRGGIAARLVNVFPEETWLHVPVVNENGKDDESVRSPFEQAVDTLAARLRLWTECARADRLARLGHYAILVLGLRGQTNWARPATPARGSDDLLYVRSYSEEHASLASLVSDAGSPLFGTPGSYRIDFDRKLSRHAHYLQTLRPPLGGPFASLVEVHASRVIHIAEDGLEDDIIGTPCLRASWNDLDDLDKLKGGSAEMYWQDAKNRLVASVQKDARLSPEDEEKLSDAFDAFVHGLRTVLQVQGIDVTQLRGSIADPSAQMDVRLDLISATQGIPKRKLMGTEQGDLASDENTQHWDTTVGRRQKRHGEDIILRPLFDRCVALGLLPIPRHGYFIEWQRPTAHSELEQSQIELNKARTIQTYAVQLEAAQRVLPLELFLSDILNYDKETVQRILEMIDEMGELPAPSQPTQRRQAGDDEASLELTL